MNANPRTLNPDLSFHSSSGAPPLDMHIMTMVLSPYGVIKQEFIEHLLGARLYLDAGINSTICRCQMLTHLVLNLTNYLDSERLNRLDRVTQLVSS